MEFVIHSVPHLKHLKFLDENGKPLLAFEDWIKYLEENKSSYDPAIRRDNILKEIRNHKDGLQIINGKRYISASSLVRFISHHCERFSACEQILKEVVSYLFRKQNFQIESTLLDLYKEIANLDSFPWLKDTINASEISQPRTLHIDYRTQFNDNEWNKILLFEHHFALENEQSLEYEEELNKKKSYFKELQHIQKLGKSLSLKCVNASSRNQKRKEVTEQVKGINFISVDHLHLYSTIDGYLEDILRIYIGGNFTVVSVDCSKSVCGETCGIHLYIEYKPDDNVTDLCNIIQCDMKKWHRLQVHHIVFLGTDVVKNYVCKNCTPGHLHRFQLHDDFFTKVLSDSVIEVKRFALRYDEHDDEIQSPVQDDFSGPNYCTACFQHISSWLDKPLDWRNVDISTEWMLFVPMEVQELFASMFINQDSLRRSENSQSFIKNKISKLYILFDSGLNIQNRNYSGIVQQLNTQELVVNYHSVSTVFDVTASAGCTQSFKTAERWLQNAADEGTSYFNTYIKKYPLRYRSIQELEECDHNVSMRDCFVIFYMDNLVRLRVHEDPDPGQSRTSQICTLPITLKGLPRDCFITENWHEDNCEDNTSIACQCMLSKDMTKEEMHLILDDTIEEKRAWKKFSSQTHTGMLSLLLSENTTKDVIDDLANAVHVPEERHITAREMSALDASMTSMNISDIAHDRDLLEELEAQNVILEDLDDTDVSLDTFLDHSIHEEDFIEGIHPLEESDTNDERSEANVEDMIRTGNGESCEDETHLQEFRVPPLICRHPVPATGRDDDKSNLKRILQDILIKLGRHGDGFQDRILFAPDHKISKNLLQLIKENKLFHQFLPEFPALHLRKSKIVNLFGAYKAAGLVHLIKYMKDSEQEDEWMKLITLQNIETATRNITRLSMALHLAFVVKFITTNDKVKQDVMQDPSTLVGKWGDEFNRFLTEGSQKNATFALHVDFMQHCDEIVAISTAERIGGKEGYNLLLSAVKHSLPFSFLNGATSYAAFCVDLLYEHYSCGVFHQQMKSSLFSTPHKDGKTNIALDTQREMDHKDAIKGFRPRSTMQSVVPRMTIVDSFVESSSARKRMMSTEVAISASNTTDRYCSSVQFNLQSKDVKHIVPVAQLILKTNSLSTEEDKTAKNMYEPQQRCLQDAILDRNTYAVGQFLIKKYMSNQQLFGLVKNDCPNVDEIEGPKEVLRKARAAKGTTLRRVATKALVTVKTSTPAESKRQAEVKKKTKIFDCMSSAMNACQALVNPDGSKATIQKSQGIKKALLRALLFSGDTEECSTGPLIYNDVKEIPSIVKNQVKWATMEFAGVKFKTKATSGEQYLQHVQNGILGRVFRDFPAMSHLVISEEKYSFTPDDFKAATRLKRSHKQSLSIAHLKTGDDVISDHKLSKSAIVHTGEGKRLISNYLARNLHKLNPKKTCSIEVDSELIMEKCKCSESCSCPPVCHPVIATYSSSEFQGITVNKDIQQRKGEAEMAQADWLKNIMPKLKESEAVVSVLTSGDIDGVVIHMFVVSLHWHRNDDGSFKNPVYVLLQKPNPDLYNITAIAEHVEKQFGFKYAAAHLAIALCMGGNDFIPKFFGISHDKWISELLLTENGLNELLKIEMDPNTNEPNGSKLNRGLYIEIIKKLYCPKVLQSDVFTMDEVRQLSMKPPGKDTRPPSSWMPPVSALHKVMDLLQCLIDYYHTSWDHSATLPNFIGRGLIKENEIVKFDFGPDARIDNLQIHLAKDESTLSDKIRTSKKKKKREISFNETRPSNEDKAYDKRKKRPMMSTPRKIRDARAMQDDDGNDK